MLSLKKSPHRHDAVLIPLAAVRYENDLHLFSYYTPLRDLGVFLNGGYSEEDEIKVYDFEQAFPHYAEPDLLRQMFRIAGALRFLHDNLELFNEAGAHCSHMDLRPANILVFPQASGVIAPGGSTVGLWKLSDFGLATLASSENSNVRTMNRQSAYLAPEWHYRHRQRASGRSSDMWSYGCIFAEVLCFWAGGKEAVATFRTSREQCSEDDSFFRADSTGSQPSEFDFEDRGTVYSRKEAVDTWLSNLDRLFPNAGVYQKLLQGTLTADRFKRWKA